MKLQSGDSVVGMIVTDDFDTSVLTISKYGMAKRSRLGSGEMIQATSEDSVPIFDDEGEPMMERDGYRKTNRGTKGVRTMALSDADSIVGVRQIPHLADQLFMLTEKDDDSHACDSDQGDPWQSYQGNQDNGAAGRQ